ncbi:MAG: chromosome segregation protein SMC [Coriobacteriia bacterium]|nr:chromosome segregation protein SMC [Coriobacteriia bacterium]
MYLKSLTLKGFKSFADRSQIVVEPGVTCIVGPNGAGKSNITDAILWVLGEQSAKSLRGTTMEDVIFAGSSARQGVGVAEVDLVLDNSDNVIPLEFDEITFTRRMYRSGESEYLINKAPARLMDILDLLHDSGLGREAHSIISQGRIDEVLKSKPEERRALIEEVAGTLKHKKRKERALRRLVALDAHLERARDIINEIDRQLRPMQRQASRAEKHKGITGALRELEVAIAVDDLRRLQDSWEKVLKSEKEAEAHIDIVTYQLSSQEVELEKYQVLLEEKGLFVGDLSEQRRSVGALLQRLEGLIALISEKEKNITSKMDELAARVDDAKMRIDHARDQVRELSDARSSTEGQLKALYSRLSELRKESETLKKARSALDKELAILRNTQHTAKAQADRATVDRNSADQTIRSLETQKTMLAERLISLDAALGIGSETLRERRSKLEELDSVLERARREMTLAESDINKRTRVVETRKLDFDRARESLINARAELKGLSDLDDAMQSISPGNERFLEAAQDRSSFRGRISEVLRVDPQLEIIVEQLLGADLAGIFVSDLEGAHALIKEAQPTDECDISLIPIEVEVPSLPDSTVGIRLIDVIECDDAYRSAIALMLGDVFVVDTLEEAFYGLKQHDNVRFVTREGITLWPSGKITQGVAQTTKESALYRSRRLVALKDTIPALEQSASHTESELTVAEEALSLAQHDAFEVGQRLAELTGERASLVLEVARNEETFQAQSNERETLKLRSAEVERELEISGRAFAELDEEIEKHLSIVARSSEDSVNLEGDRESRFAEETRLLGLLNECQVEIAQVSERDAYMKRTHTQATDEAQRLEQILGEEASIRHELETMRDRALPLRELCAELLERAEAISGSLNDRAQFEQTDSVSLRDTIRDAQDKIRELRETQTGAHEALSQVKVEKAQLDVQVNAAVRTIVDDHGIPLEKALEADELDDRALAEDEAFALRKKLSNLGAINPIAAHEYDILKERRDFMNTQMDDLLAARKTLGKVVNAIDKKMRERFLDTFEQVDGHFQDIFAILFPGGSAQLILTDPDEIDTTGIEYIVQPRGKKVRKMSLLSGGENSLSALALLFALNRVRPCPFFVLDEVEAALDDSNLRRFIAFIDTMRDSTQFLIVTHQRRTMEMADVLYGVSMQSDGVSKLVSQRLEGALELVGKDLKGA